jgi:hypothetical protein
LDAMTGRRLRYLVNGPSTRARWEDIYAAVAYDRVTLTDARLWAEPPSPEERSLFTMQMSGKTDWGRLYRHRHGGRLKAIEAAQAAT